MMSISGMISMRARFLGRGEPKYAWLIRRARHRERDRDLHFRDSSRLEFPRLNALVAALSRIELPMLCAMVASVTDPEPTSIETTQTPLPVMCRERASWDTGLRHKWPAPRSRNRHGAGLRYADLRCLDRCGGLADAAAWAAGCFLRNSGTSCGIGGGSGIGMSSGGGVGWSSGWSRVASTVAVGMSARFTGGGSRLMAATTAPM